MLATITIENWIGILGILIPIVVAVLLVTWKWQAKQDQDINDVDKRVVVAETKIKENKDDLERGKDRFVSIAQEIGKQNTTLAGLTAEVGGLTRAQIGIDKKLGRVLEHLGPKES